MYKGSQFNIYYGDLIFNTLKRSLIKVDSSTINSIKQGELIDFDIQTLKMLEALGIIVEKGLDEIEFFKFYYKNLKYDKRILNITYIPSYSCNCTCTYCYASLMVKKAEGVKEPNNDEKFITWFKHTVSTLNPSKVDFSFHGGEPLLHLRRLENIGQSIATFLKEKNIELNSSIVTNGTLLNMKALKVLKSINLKNIMVTVDGPSHVHDKRRPFKNGKGTFDLVFKNIRVALEEGFNVVITQNVDTQNLESVDALLATLKENNFDKYDNFYYLLSAVKYGEGYQNLSHFSQFKPLSQKTYAEIKLKAMEKALEYGFHVVSPIGTGICTLKQINALIVDTYGNIYKCVTLTGHSSAKVGSIFEPLELVMSRFFNFDHLEPWEREQCLHCIYLPLCQGGCMQQAKISNPDKPLGTEINCLKEYLDNLFPKVIEIAYNERKVHTPLNVTSEFGFNLLK